MAMPRCPGCNKIGSPRLGGYCKICFPNNNKTWAQDRTPMVRDWYGTESFFRKTPFISDKFGCIKDKFDINPRY